MDNSFDIQWIIQLCFSGSSMVVHYFMNFFAARYPCDLVTLQSCYLSIITAIKTNVAIATIAAIEAIAAIGAIAALPPCNPEMKQ